MIHLSKCSRGCSWRQWKRNGRHNQCSQSSTEGRTIGDWSVVNAQSQEVSHNRFFIINMVVLKLVNTWLQHYYCILGIMPVRYAPANTMFDPKPLIRRLSKPTYEVVMRCSNPSLEANKQSLKLFCHKQFSRLYVSNLSIVPSCKHRKNAFSEITQNTKEKA